MRSWVRFKSFASCDGETGPDGVYLGVGDSNSDRTVNILDSEYHGDDPLEGLETSMKEMSVSDRSKQQTASTLSFGGEQPLSSFPL